MAESPRMQRRVLRRGDIPEGVMGVKAVERSTEQPGMSVGEAVCAEDRDATQRQGHLRIYGCRVVRFHYHIQDDFVVK